MSIEGRDPVNTETPHDREAGVVDDEQVRVTPKNTDVHATSKSAKVTASIGDSIRRLSRNRSAALRSSLW
jgi:hypothetical protein